MRWDGWKHGSNVCAMLQCRLMCIDLVQCVDLRLSMVCVQDDESKTAHQHAMDGDHSECLEILRAAESKAKLGRKLIKAAALNEVEEVKSLIVKEGVPVNYKVRDVLEIRFVGRKEMK